MNPWFSAGEKSSPVDILRFDFFLSEWYKIFSIRLYFSLDIDFRSCKVRCWHSEKYRQHNLPLWMIALDWSLGVIILVPLPRHNHVYSIIQSSKMHLVLAEIKWTCLFKECHIYYIVMYVWPSKKEIVNATIPII